MQTTRHPRLIVPLTIAFLLGAARLSASGFSLRTQEVVAADGASVDVAVSLDPGQSNIAALSFQVDFDTTRLHFDAQSKTGEDLDDIEVDAPASFGGSSFYLSDRSRIAISLYPTRLPIGSLSGGTVARIRFNVIAGTQGFAAIHLTEVTAADSVGLAIAPAAIADGGVVIETPRPLLRIAPTLLSFGSVATGSHAERSIIVSNDGSAELKLDRISIDGADYSLSSPFETITLRPGDVRAINVSFEATSYGVHSGSLTLDAAQQHLVIPLHASVDPSTLPTFSERWIIPAAVHASGAEDSVWRTALALLNSGSTAAQIHLNFVSSNGERFDALALSIGPGHSYQSDDVVAAIVGDRSLSGWLTVEATSPDIAVRATLINSSSVTRRSQEIPTLSSDGLYRSGMTARLIDVERSATQRTNIGILNPTDSALAVHLLVLDQSGAGLVERDYIVPARALLQPLDVLDALGEQRHLTVSFTCVSSNGTFYPFASTIESSGSLLFQEPR